MKKKIMPGLKSAIFFGSLILLLVVGILKLSPSELYAQAPSTYWNVERDGSNNLNFYLTNAGVNGSTLFKILNNGRVGIGTTTPVAPLQVDFNASAPTSHGVRVVNTNTTPGRTSDLNLAVFDGANYLGSRIYHSSDSPYCWTCQRLTFALQQTGYDTYADVLSLNSSGNMGLGTINPNGKFDIYNNGANGDGVVMAPDISMDNNFTIQTYIDSLAGGGWANRTTYATACCNNLALQPDVGSVSIGGPGGNFQPYKLWVNGNANFNGYINAPGGIQTNGAMINFPGYGGIAQAYGQALYPGRVDGSGGNWQQSWYLASHSSYGLYTNTGMYMAGNLYVPYILDAQNPGYYLDPNGTSSVVNLYRNGGFNGREYDVNNAGYFADPDSISILNDVRANVFYDQGNTGYYLDPNATSNSNLAYFQDVRSLVYYDSGNPAYFTQPRSRSRMNDAWFDTLSCMSSWCPGGGIVRLTPNLHLNSVQGYAVYLNWDNGYNASTQFVVGNGQGGLALTVNGNGAFRSYGQTQRFDGQVGIWGYDPGACGGGFGLCVGGASGGQSGWNNTSDVRLKKNIVTIPNALDKVMDLRGVYFDFIDKEGVYKNLPKGKQVGFIAQEVEKVLPEVVTTGDDGMKMLSYANITALLAEGIKEQQTQVNEIKVKGQQAELTNQDQQKEIEQLKAEIAELKKLLSDRSK